MKIWFPSSGLHPASFSWQLKPFASFYLNHSHLLPQLLTKRIFSLNQATICGLHFFLHFYFYQFIYLNFAASIIYLNKIHFDSKIMLDKLLCVYHSFFMEVSLVQIINIKKLTKSACSIC